MKNQTTTQAPVNLSTNQAGQGKVHLLSAHGYFAGNRDAKIKPEFSGRFMVRDTQDQDGFCIVGDDLSDLGREALEHLDIDLENFLNVEYRKYVNDVAEGNPMQLDDWLAGSDIPEIVAARQLLEGKAPQNQKFRVLGAHPNRNFFDIEVEAINGQREFGVAALVLKGADEEGEAEFFAAIPAGTTYDFPGDSVVTLETVLAHEQAEVFGLAEHEKAKAAPSLGM